MAASAAVALTATTAAARERNGRPGLRQLAVVTAAEPGRAPRLLGRGRRSGRARQRQGRGGGGRRGAGPPALGSATDCGAAGRCVITMARSLCPGAWLRKPYYLQVGWRRARRGPSFAVRYLPASLLFPQSAPARTPLPPAVGTWRRALPAAQAPQPPRQHCPRPPTVALAPPAPGPARLWDSGRPARARHRTPRFPGAPRRDSGATL